ncbi:zinc finger protein draculin-like [Lutzomyia longipalpis]|uniref:zinc finger protein draculin-like n=1 Tax=Lutzomyia longipalpis TaxID=7200 RepID=UPI0024833EF3|nr:zinc finger protein draculin-like [Lutzomyia longipalpis]
MNSIFNLEIYEKDAWPKRICTCCKEKAKSCIDFIQNIKDGERKLLELFGEKFQDQKKEIIFSEDLTKVELKQEVLVHAVKLSSGDEGEDVLVTDKSDRTSSEWRPYSLEESETDTTDKIDFQQNTKNVKKKCGRKRELSKQVSDNENKRTIKMENESVVKKYLGFKCEICTHQAKSYFALKYHFRDTHGIKGYLICCETKFTHLGILAGHLKKHFDPECFKCSKCCKVLSNQKSLMTHIQDCMKDPKTYAYICEVCSKAHPSSRALYCHRRKMHSTEADKTHRCSECSKSYLTPSELKYHYLYSHDTKKHSVCDICGKGFRTKWQAKTHLKIAHLNKGLPKVKCDRCGGYYTSDFTLKQHQRRCQADPVTCNYCEKTYCNEVALKKHIKY